MIPKNRSLIELKTAEDIARQYFPDELPNILTTIIWGCTGWPAFWQHKDKTPIENFRMQLLEAQQKGWQKVLEESWP